MQSCMCVICCLLIVDFDEDEEGAGNGYFILFACGAIDLPGIPWTSFHAGEKVGSWLCWQKLAAVG